MQVRAYVTDQAVSPSKVRGVLNLIQGRPVPEALTLLRFLPQPSARVVWKVLRSAAANAENNFNLNPDALVIRAATAGDGKTLRRFKARSRGRASPRLRRRSNIEIVVEGDEGY
jgi:large subunit ribosomal protein L22